MWNVNTTLNSYYIFEIWYLQFAIQLFHFMLYREIMFQMWNFRTSLNAYYTTEIWYLLFNYFISYYKTDLILYCPHNCWISNKHIDLLFFHRVTFHYIHNTKHTKFIIIFQNVSSEIWYFIFAMYLLHFKFWNQKVIFHYMNYISNT